MDNRTRKKVREGLVALNHLASKEVPIQRMLDDPEGAEAIPLVCFLRGVAYAHGVSVDELIVQAGGIPAPNEPSTPKCELGEVATTERGFEIVAFNDAYDARCSLQQSSLAETEPPGSSAVWLGTVADRVHRMHLKTDQVKDLIAVLLRWLETGSFIPVVEDP